MLKHRRRQVVHSTHGIGFVQHEVGRMCFGDVRFYIEFYNGRAGVYDADDLIFIPTDRKVFDYGHA